MKDNDAKFRQQFSEEDLAELKDLLNRTYSPEVEKASGLVRTPWNPETLRSENVVIFGATPYGGLAFFAMQELGISVRCFCDNDPRKQGTTLLERPVLSPQELVSQYPEATIFLAIPYFDELIKQLSELGFTKLRDCMSLYAKVDIWKLIEKQRNVFEFSPSVSLNETPKRILCYARLFVLYMTLLERLGDSRQAVLDDYFGTRVKNEFPSICGGWMPSLRDQFSPKLPFVFIFGVPNGGTTILKRILSEHPEISARNKESTRETYLFCSGLSDQAVLEGLMRWEKDASDSGKSVILEKTPQHIFYWQRIVSLVSNRKFIFIMRDGRDVVAGNAAMQRFNREFVAQMWIDSIKEYEMLQRALCGDTFLVHLKDFQSSPETTIRKMLEFVGVGSDLKTVEYMLQYHERASAAGKKIEKPASVVDCHTASQLRNHQIQQPLQKSTSRWKRDLPYEEFPELHEKMKPWLIKYGYMDEEPT